MVVAVIAARLITQGKLRKIEQTDNYQFYSKEYNNIIRTCDTSP